MELIECKCASAMHLKSFFLASKTFKAEQSDHGLEDVRIITKEGLKKSPTLWAQRITRQQ